MVALLLVSAAASSGCAATAGADDGPGAATASPTAPVAPGALVPTRGAYLGLFHGSGAVADATGHTTAAPEVDLTYSDWADDWATAPSTTQDLAAGRIPLVNWEPVDVDFHDIVDGRYDAMISARATAAARLQHGLFLDFAAEMNEEEGWGGHDPALYTAAWRHVHDLFTAAGARNVVWVWAPNNTDSAGAPPALHYYPGDAYVDWTGMDGYNWGTSRPGSVWQSFEQVFGPLYDRLAGLGKPVMIAETASDEVGGSKAEWIADLVPTLRTHFPDVRAVVWFDIDKERHWQIDSSPASRAAFASMADDPYWSH